MGLSLKISQLREFLEEILKILYYYRGRVVFSFAGVALGILSICIIITTIEGANKKAHDIFEVLGPDSIMVFGGGERQRAARTRMNTLTFRDAELLERIDGIYDLMKVYQVRDIMIKYKGDKWQTRVVGSTINYFDSFSWGFQFGSAFTMTDYNNAEAVCIIGSKVFDELFHGESAIGKTVLVGKLPTKVIGVLEEKGGGLGGPNIDDRVIMPLTTVMSRIANEKKYLGMMRLKSNRDIDMTVKI